EAIVRRRAKLDARSALDLGAESIEATILDRVFEPRMLAVFPITPVALHSDNRLGDFHRIGGLAEAHDLADTRISVKLTVGHAHAAADSYIPTGDLTRTIRNGDITQIMRKNIDVIRWRHRHYDLEFAWQISLAIDRLHYFLLAASDALAVKPDFTIGRRVRQQVVGDGAC